MIGFSSLACPEWDAANVVEQAARMGFDAIEWRGGPDGHVMALTAAERAAVRRQSDELGLKAISVTAYPSFVHPDRAARRASVEHVTRHAAVASEFGAPYVRVWAGPRVDDAALTVLEDRLVDGLLRAIESVDGLGVTLVLEPHDDVVSPIAVRRVLERASGSGIGVIWEIANTWIAEEDPFAALSLLKPWLSYVQVKDGVGRGSRWRPTLLGCGDVPLGAALRVLADTAPDTPISIEWERPWYPHLAAAEDALPECLEYVRNRMALSNTNIPGPAAI